MLIDGVESIDIVIFSPLIFVKIYYFSKGPKKNAKIVFLIQKLWESYGLSGFVPIEQWINQIL